MTEQQNYIQSPLNSSVSKYAFAFPKADRFDKSKRVPTEVKYTLPSMIEKRACSFGYGNKSSLVLDRCSPPPGAYESQSLFRKEKKSNSPSFGMSRDSILFGSYLTEARRKSLQIPSPNRYDIKLPKTRIGGTIAIRTQTQPSVKNRQFPGPGAYNLDTIEMAYPNTFALSNFRKESSPKYHQSKTIEIDNPRNTRKRKFYDIQEKEFGKSKVSRFRNVSIASFGKQKKMMDTNKWKISVPGHKYKVFSQFGSSYK